MAYNEDIKIPFLPNDEPTHTVSLQPTGEGSRDVEGERRVRQSIEDASQRNTTLLTEIMETEEAVSGLQNSEIRLKRAKEELAEQDNAVRKVLLQVKERQALLVRRRDSKSRKWYYILTHMRRELEAKIQEAQTSYYESVAVQNQTERRQRELRQDLDSIEVENTELKHRVKQHGEAHKEIDDLYSLIFSGPTPGFPDEDEQEARYKARKAEHKATVATLKSTAKATKEVEGISGAIDRAKAESNRAEYESDSIFFLPEYAAIFLERCKRIIDHGLKLLQNMFEALPRPLDTDVVQAHKNLREALVDARQDATEGINETYPSRSELLQSVRKIDTNLANASKAQKSLIGILKTYGNTAKEAVTLSSRELEDARQALHAIRQNAFEITVGFGAAAPPYNECCDRADWFTNDAVAQCNIISVPAINEAALPPPPSYEGATA